MFSLPKSFQRMNTMKRNAILVVSGVFFLVGCVAGVLISRFPVEAQRSTGNNWEYAAITGYYTPYPADNPGSIATMAVNICYLQVSGCRNEEVTASVPYAKFIQDNRLENSEQSRALARNKAQDDAYTKAIAKLGQEGWELSGPTNLQFDTAYTAPSGSSAIDPGVKDRKEDIYFKRRK